MSPIDVHRGHVSPTEGNGQRSVSSAVPATRRDAATGHPHESVLVADDDSGLLSRLEDRYHGTYRVLTALSFAEATRVVQDYSSIAVAIIGVTQPVTDVLDCVREIRTIDPSISIVILAEPALTEAIQNQPHEGDEVLILSRSISLPELDSVLSAGLERHRNLCAADRQEQQILLGSLKSMLSMLGLVCPEALEHAARVKRYAVGVGRLLGKPTSPQDHRCRPARPGSRVFDLDEIACAAVLSHIGCVALPPGLVSRALSGAELTAYESGLYQTHPLLGESIIRKVNRLERIAQAVKYQTKNYDGSGAPMDEPAGKDLPATARVLRVVLDYDRLVHAGERPATAVSIMRGRSGAYDPEIFTALEVLLGLTDVFRPMPIGNAARYDTADRLAPCAPRVLNRCEMTPIGARVYRLKSSTVCVA